MVEDHLRSHGQILNAGGILSAGGIWRLYNASYFGLQTKHYILLLSATVMIGVLVGVYVQY